MRIDSAGKVGIGASSIDGNSNLQIQNDSGNALLRLRSGTSNLSGVDFGDSGDIDIGGIRYSNASNHMQFNVNAAERMRIDSAGNVGIGTNSPDGILDIEGNFESNKALVLTNTKGTGKVSYIRSHGINGESLALYHDGTRRQRWDSSGYTAFETSTDTERMRIDASGNVGIGTSSPDSKLDVSHGSSGEIARFTSPNGTSSYITIGRDSSTAEGFTAGYNSSNGDCTLTAISATHPIIFKQSTTERMRIDSSGIDVTGTVVADALTVDSNGELIELNYANDGGSALIAWKSSAGATLWDIGGGVVAAQDEFAIRRAGSAKFIIKSDGNVGIGTNSPATALSVVGDITTTGGVYLGGTGAANKLDDYEEGTFTPAITFGGASVGLTYTAARGRYTKVGRLVTVQIGIDINNKGTSTGDMNVTGLPFGTATFSGGYGGQLGAMRVEGGWTGLTGAMIPFIDENGATLIVIRQGTSTGTNPVTDANTTSGYFFIAATYMSA